MAEREKVSAAADDPVNTSVPRIAKKPAHAAGGDADDHQPGDGAAGEAAVATRGPAAPLSVTARLPGTPRRSAGTARGSARSRPLPAPRSPKWLEVDGADQLGQRISRRLRDADPHEDLAAGQGGEVQLGQTRRQLAEGTEQEHVDRLAELAAPSELVGVAERARNHPAVGRVNVAVVVRIADQAVRVNPRSPSSRASHSATRTKVPTIRADSSIRAIEPSAPNRSP